VVLQQQFFTAAFKEVLKSTSGVELGYEWLNYAMKFMVETKTRDTCFGADVQKIYQDKWPVTHMFTYLKCGGNCEDTVAWVKDVEECVMTYLSESVGEGDEMYYPFEEEFRKEVSPGLLKLLETYAVVKLLDIGIEVGATKSLDELCMDDFISDAVFYFLGTVWKKHQNYIINYPVYNGFLLLITYPSIPCYFLSSGSLSHIFVVSHGEGTYGRTMLLFCMVLGLVASKTMYEALTFRTQSVLGYAIENNLLGAHGWSCVRILSQKTSYNKMLDKIRRCV
jgi:hypothetical protein